MTPYQFHHVFAFVDPQSCDFERLEKLGFTLTAGRAHSGQGTANRSICFANGYLELIFISDVEDARQNPVQLLRRSEWEKSGASPFGIGLTGTIPQSDAQAFWRYQPPYSPGLVIYQSNLNENRPQHPLCFVMDLGVSPSPLQKSLPEISQITMTCVGGCKFDNLPDIIHITPGDSPMLELTFISSNQMSLDINNIVRIKSVLESEIPAP